MELKLAIVGTHPDTREQAPWDEPAFEIWAFNEVLGQKTWCKRADVIFQMHDPAIYRSQHNRSHAGHWDWLQQDHGDLKIYMQNADPQVPNSVRYPLEYVQSLGCNFNKDLLLTSSIAQALALAALVDYDIIRVYGVEMRSDTEYRNQREGVIAWIYYLLGRGANVEFIGGEEIFNKRLYGYDGSLFQTINPFDERAAELREQIAAQKAVIEEADKTLSRSFFNGHLAQRIGEYSELKTELGKLEGALHEAERYGHKCAEMLVDAGMCYIDRNEYEGAAAQAHNDAAKFGQDVYKTLGYVEMITASWVASQSPTVRPQLASALETHFTVAYNSGFAQGIQAENQRWATDLDERALMYGGERAAKMAFQTE